MYKCKKLKKNYLKITGLKHARKKLVPYDCKMT